MDESLLKGLPYVGGASASPIDPVKAEAGSPAKSREFAEKLRPSAEKTHQAVFDDESDSGDGDASDFVGDFGGFEFDNGGDSPDAARLEDLGEKPAKVARIIDQTAQECQFYH